MAEQARVVVIGGGIMGTSLLYHLAHEGWTDCVLLEKGELTSGSTWHAAGQVTHSTSSFVLGRMAGYAIELYRRLEAETGQSVTWHGCGSLRVAYTEDELDWLHHTTSVGRVLGHPMELVGPERIRELHPFYNLDGIRAALHTPEDGHVDPAGAAFALAKGARMLGAKVLRQRRATGIEALPGGEWLVRTDKGDIVCEHVVSASGVHARQTGAMVGLDVPVLPAEHQYLVTEPHPDIVARHDAGLPEMPVFRDPDASYYMREERGGLVLGIYEQTAPICFEDGPPET